MRKISLRLCVPLCVSVLLSVSLRAQLSLDKIFTDHILLQRGKKVSVWGKAIPGNTVYLSFKNQNKKTVAAKDSSWSITLDPLVASASPSSIIVSSGKKQLVVKDVLVGDVWVCLGQSNMEWPMSQEEHYAEERSHLPNSRLRFYDPVYAGQGIYAKSFSDSVMRSLNRDDFYSGSWALCDTNSIKGMSAVGYYFGKTIAAETEVPIGLINLAIGGAPIETFISSASLLKQFPAKVRGNWLENESLPVWVRQRGRENVGGTAMQGAGNRSDQGYKDLVGISKTSMALPDTTGPDHAFKPGFAFESGIKPLAKFPVKGIIWYQGESNAQEPERVREYADLQRMMVQDLRANWRDTSLGFYYVQLSSIDSVRYRSQLWPWFRDEQRKMMSSIPHSGMVVSSDHGAMHDVHPRNKKVVGERLARWALMRDYGSRFVPSGPLPIKAVRYDSVIRVYFEYAEGLRSAGAVQGFSVDGEDVAAEVDGSTVLVRVPRDREPRFLYYGWRPYSDGNLVNAAGLPTSTFSLSIDPVPALIPLPRRVTWTSEQFHLPNLDDFLAAFHSTPPLSKSPLSKSPLSKSPLSKSPLSKSPLSKSPLSKSGIDIRIDSSINNPEGYRLRITTDSVIVTAAGPKGAFNALQIILQLKKGPFLQGCEIEDWPAFPWRGYMVDVGRNFMSMDLLKQQIDVMARYKLNVFHFHLTEDIAWRIEIPGFPQLTKGATMIRNKGSYYSVNEMKELMRYCKERNITLVPEIDMPGHSAAFERAMGMKMQSPEGKKVIKKILESFCNTYELEYIHIGGDEVRISDSSFLPEMVSLLKARGKKVIGWDPGGNYGDNVIRQLWMRDPPKDDGHQYIESRHLYINHMDPLESITTIFYRKIGDADSAMRYLKGATLCLWHDRNVRSESDLMIMNPVYPALLAFAEKSWRGGGEAGWITNTPDPATFKEFEDRLLAHKKENFSTRPFPYWQQSNLTWDLYGPYSNGGDLKKNFLPDTTLLGVEPVLQATGATIILRHFWHPVVMGTLSKSPLSKSPLSKSPGLEENITWYASTQLWSDADTTAQLRIGFNNFSRSYVTDSPQEGTWNNLHSKIYVNDVEIAPPRWKQAGMKGDLEKPLIDEGYEYREPHRIKLKKGWNRVVVKLPVGSFETISNGNPVKWMFTVVKED